jgi:hypothetical protein
MNAKTLKVVKENQILFESDKRWLHPLFDLEKFLTKNSMDLSGAMLHDKVVGKAAAMLMVRLGAGSVHAQVLSKLGKSILESNSITYMYHILVDRIDCQTEELLENIDDLETAYKLLKERATR